jgi:hypothetical protein
MTKKKARSIKSQKKARDDGLLLVVVVFIVTSSLAGYLLAEMLLALQPHPYHWAVMGLSGISGWFLGRISYRYKGDIV